jgi:hypothetical protein
VICAAAVSLPLLLVSEPQDVLKWVFSHTLELWVVAALALFCVTTFSQLLPAAAFVMAFYLLARSIAAIELISQSTLIEPGPASGLAAFLAKAISVMLPHLDAFAQTAWLIGATAQPLSIASAILQTLIYVSLLLFAAMFDLSRRNF